MPTLDERLRRDLKRLSEPVEPGRLFERVARRRARRVFVRRIQAGALALAVLGGSALGTYGLLRGFRGAEREPAHPPPAPFPSAFDDLPVGWTELPPPPEVRTAAATVWTGERLIVWGGYVFTGGGDKRPEADGFVFDTGSGTWESIAPSVLEARALPASAWTGREMLIWGGWHPQLEGELYGDGAAYDPAADAWRELPPPPITPRAPLSVWTGREWIVWGTAVRVDERPRDGAAYDPVVNTWRKIAEAPIELTDATAVWTGEEMIVFGAALHGGNVAETETAIGAAYDPTTDAWRRLPDSELSPQASSAAWNGRELVAWDYLGGTAHYDPGADRWRGLPKSPLGSSECPPRVVAVQGYVLGDLCGLTALYDPGTRRWRDISRPEFVGWGFGLVAADPIVLLLGRSVDTGEERMLAYRPTALPGSVPSPSDPEHLRDDLRLFGDGRCGRIQLTSRDDGHRVRPRSGAPGDRLIVAGTTLRGEDGRWAPADRMEVWWNVGYTTTPGENSVLLTAFDPGRACRFEVATQVPPAAPGVYPVNVIVYHGDTHGPFLPSRFRVLPGVSATRAGVEELVRAFIERRAAGSGAERYLSEEGIRDYTSEDGTLLELYAPRPIRFGAGSIVFVDGPLGPEGSYEVGIKIARFADGERVGPLRETLFVTPEPVPGGDGTRLVIVGGRPGLEGP